MKEDPGKCQLWLFPCNAETLKGRGTDAKLTIVQHEYTLCQMKVKIVC